MCVCECVVVVGVIRNGKLRQSLALLLLPIDVCVCLCVCFRALGA